jgi:predicted component of type VI protein secretion system
MNRLVTRIHASLVTVWPLVQTTAAATLAWILARNVVGNHEPFFAPIAAVVALSQPFGERGLNALRLVAGVVVGIVAGELAIFALEGGYGTLALATFVAMAAASALRGARLVVVQAGAAAILTVAVANGEGGINRLTDALLGAGVALVFSQLLFSPEPVGMVRRAQSEALAGLAAGLELTADALARDDDGLGEQATTRLRGVRDQLVDLERTRRASTRVVRHSLAWHARMVPVVQECENAGHLDLVGDSCVMLARAAMSTARSERFALAPCVRTVADALHDLSEAPGDRARRQDAVERLLEVARRLARAKPSPAGTPVAAATTMLRIVIGDVIVYAGVDPDEAAEAVSGGTGAVRVSAPPAVSRRPFTTKRRHPRR